MGTITPGVCRGQMDVPEFFRVHDLRSEYRLALLPAQPSRDIGPELQRFGDVAADVLTGPANPMGVPLRLRRRLIRMHPTEPWPLEARFEFEPVRVFVAERPIGGAVIFNVSKLDRLLSVHRFPVPVVMRAVHEIRLDHAVLLQFVVDPSAPAARERQEGARQ